MSTPDTTRSDLDALREALWVIRQGSFDTMDECRWCGNEYDEDHAPHCAALIARAALASLATGNGRHTEADR